MHKISNLKKTTVDSCIHLNFIIQYQICNQQFNTQCQQWQKRSLNST